LFSKKKKDEWKDIISMYHKIQASESKLTKESLDEKLPKVVSEYEERLEKFDSVMKDSLVTPKRRVDIEGNFLLLNLRPFYNTLVQKHWERSHWLCQERSF